MPGIALRPKELLFDSRRYIEAELTLVGAWVAVVVVLSQAFVVLVALGLFRRLLVAVFRRGGDIAGLAIHESQSSAWWIAFTQYPVTEAIPYVGCQLSDGSYVSGLLHAFSRDWEDLPDRDLVLLGPIRFRPAKAHHADVLEDVGMVVVSARNIAMMTVTYQPTAAVENVNASEAVDGGTAAAAVPTLDSSNGTAGQDRQTQVAPAIVERSQ
jgi:hypothetical protein